ncbi:golgin subfamily A member 5-like [Clarias magur]|uniref:Golgin subfamily A member 5-like n=1 Tax=Clarias magur TaxID=1594786 RepID=A0A8J4TUP8_CLAMG|nr:golgin subfamily A member 5-like [Clarias magur]
MDRLELLENYNKDPHENFSHLVTCIENMEGELQCSKTELNSLKEKCKRLQENYTSCQQAYSVLNQKLQSVVDSMTTEQKDHFHRISALTKRLDSGKNTIISEETINIPSYIGEVLDTRFASEDAATNLLFSSSLCGQLDNDKSDRTVGPRDNKSSMRKRDYGITDWLLPVQGDSADRQEHVAAFLPWAEIQDPWVGLKKTDASAPPLLKIGDSNLHSSAVDVNSAICRKIQEGQRARPLGHKALVRLRDRNKLHQHAGP